MWRAYRSRLITEVQLVRLERLGLLEPEGVVGFRLLVVGLGGQRAYDSVRYLISLICNMVHLVQMLMLSVW